MPALPFWVGFVWFCLDTSPGKTNRTRQNESRRKDESRRIKMNRTVQDESDESRRIWPAALPFWLPAFARKSRKCAQIRAKLHQWHDHDRAGKRLRHGDQMR